MRKTSGKDLAEVLKIKQSRGLEAVLKAKLIAAVAAAAERKSITHLELAQRSGIPRSSVTGILSGSLQKITLNRVLRLLEAAHLTADIRIKEAA